MTGRRPSSDHRIARLLRRLEIPFAVRRWPLRNSIALHAEIFPVPLAANELMRIGALR